MIITKKKKQLVLNLVQYITGGEDCSKFRSDTIVGFPKLTADENLTLKKNPQIYDNRKVYIF